MKKIKLLILLSLLLLTACSSTNITLSTKNTRLSTITIRKAEKSLFNYQGIAQMDIKGLTNVASVLVKEINYSSNQNGTSVLLKGDGKSLNVAEIKEIQSSISKGKKFDKIVFSNSDIVRKGGEFSIRFQYLILDTPAESKERRSKKKCSYEFGIL